MTISSLLAFKTVMNYKTWLLMTREQVLRGIIYSYLDDNYPMSLVKVVIKYQILFFLSIVIFLFFFYFFVFFYIIIICF